MPLNYFAPQSPKLFSMSSIVYELYRYRELIIGSTASQTEAILLITFALGNLAARFFPGVETTIKMTDILEPHLLRRLGRQRRAPA
jgi:hypothetical protein